MLHFDGLPQEESMAQRVMRQRASIIQDLRAARTVDGEQKSKRKGLGGGLPHATIVLMEKHPRVQEVLKGAEKKSAEKRSIGGSSVCSSRKGSITKG
jgi:hypothetical protein